MAEKEEPQYKISDSIIEPLRILEGYVKKRDEQKHKQYMVNIMRTLFGSSLRLASLKTRNEAISGEYDRYQISQRTSPVLEIRNYARILWEYHNFLKKSKSVTIDKLPEIIRRRIARQENKLERTLKERGITDEKKGRIYYLIGDMVHLNGFYEDLGEQIESLFLTPTSLEEQENLRREYDGKARNIREELEEKGVDKKRIKIEIRVATELLVADKLEEQEKSIIDLLKEMKKRERIN